MISKLTKLYNTLCYLKPTQAIYQVKNRLIKVGSLSSFELPLPPTQPLQFFEAHAINQFLKVESNQFQFDFLNLSRTYTKDAIDWNDQTHGKLWNYNLQYLDFLKQTNVSLEVKVFLVKDIYSWLWAGKLPLEPYPASLRIMNVIRFLSTHELDQVSKEQLTTYVFAEVNYLSQNLEFHLLANHLLENAFALWMGALFFDHSKWQSKASLLLKSQLEEQILNDGAHYELAPMYHQIILFRVLEAYFLSPVRFVVKFVLKEKADAMLSWMRQMTFENGSLPHFNDTTEGIAYSPAQLQEIAKSIGLEPTKISLSDSGYRSLEVNGLKLIADLEGIKPSYQPGHAHADTFSFVLHQGSNPVIVDPGISTYDIGPRRDWERSTLAHNTVTINRQNSSQVWAGFRVAKRANVFIKEDNPDSFLAFHDGFGSQIHQREFKKIQNGIEIHDIVINPKSGSLLEARLFFHPEVTPKPLSANRFQVTEDLILELDHAEKLEWIDYEFALGYNRLIPAKSLCISIKENALLTRFIILK